MPPFDSCKLLEQLWNCVGMIYNRTKVWWILFMRNNQVTPMVYGIANYFVINVVMIIWKYFIWKYSRAGQDQGGPRWDTLTKKSKSTKLLHIVLCYTQGVVAYDPVLFLGCIPPPLTPLQVKPEALILISIGGRTLQCGVMYIFYVLVLPKLTFNTYCGIGKSKGL